ncbi:MAG: SDR family oxidoreductase [Gemmatimonadota bacterium]|nr:SDR family oxidoreductase [Gemmatimonadota bacterium]
MSEPSRYEQVRASLRENPRRWLITGVAGFIGSNLLESLLELGQPVVGLDNFSTGRESNLADVEESVGPDRWGRFRLIRGDLSDFDACRRGCEGAPIVLHQGALGAVPRSIEDPLASHESNTTGTVNLLAAAKDAGVERIVYASSSSVYGDDPGLPKREEHTGEPLSPYAATKVCTEVYAEVFARTYGLEVVGLRYFNVFGPRQDPDGPYAAVIPRWIAEMASDEPVTIYGDGETSRDFCYVENAVQANLLAATTEDREAIGEVYNVAVQERTSLNELFRLLRDMLAPRFPRLEEEEPVYADFRPGDVRHSEADITRARERLGYRPTHTLREGLAEALPWYVGERTVGI